RRASRPSPLGGDELAKLVVAQLVRDARSLVDGFPRLAHLTASTEDTCAGELASRRRVDDVARCLVELQRDVVLVERLVARAEGEPAPLVVRRDVDEGAEDALRVLEPVL